MNDDVNNFDTNDTTTDEISSESKAWKAGETIKKGALSALGSLALYALYAMLNKGKPQGPEIKVKGKVGDWVIGKEEKPN